MRVKVLAWVRSERGQGLVEFALVLPMFLMVLFAIAEFGRVYQRSVILTNATREGARVAAVGSDTTAITNAVKTAAPSMTPSVTVTNAKGTSGTNVTVNATAVVPTVTPMGRLINYVTHRSFATSFNLTSSTSMRLE